MTKSERYLTVPPDILQSCCLKGFWFSYVSCCKTAIIQSGHFLQFELPHAGWLGLGANNLNPLHLYLPTNPLEFLDKRRHFLENALFFGQKLWV